MSVIIVSNADFDFPGGTRIKLMIESPYIH